MNHKQPMEQLKKSKVYSRADEMLDGIISRKLQRVAEADPALLGKDLPKIPPASISAPAEAPARSRRR